MKFTWASISLVLIFAGCKTTPLHQQVTSNTTESVKIEGKKSKNLERKRDIEVALGARTPDGSIPPIATGFPKVTVANPGSVDARVEVPEGLEPDTEIAPLRRD